PFRAPARHRSCSSYGAQRHDARRHPGAHSGKPAGKLGGTWECARKADVLPATCKYRHRGGLQARHTGEHHGVDRSTLHQVQHLPQSHRHCDCGVVQDRRNRGRLPEPVEREAACHQSPLQPIGEEALGQRCLASALLHGSWEPDHQERD
ncbi:ANKRD17, partial [Symbiodinium sp. CCMP2456]